MICQQPSNVTTVRIKVSTVVIKGIANVLGYFLYLRNITLDISRAWKIVAQRHSAHWFIGARNSLLRKAFQNCKARFR